MENSRATALLFRVAAHIAIAFLAVTLPGVGPNRYWVAALLLCVGSPLAVLINLRVREQSRNWAEALLDLVMILFFVHLVPHLWMVCMCLGLMVAMAPSVSLHRSSHWIYLGFGTLLVAGMTLALVIHDVSGWALPLIAVAVTYPSMLYYTYSQMQRYNEVRQRADMVKGMTELAGSVAHDFNNMLTTVSGHAELARLQLNRDHSARQYLDQVIQGSERASLLSQQLLSFSGRDVQRTDEVDLAAEAHMIAGLLGPVVPSGVSIRVDSPSNLWVTANTQEVNQILMNLILNAGEAMIGQTGEILVELKKEVGHNKELEANRETIYLSVHDSGPGISQSMVARMAEPFTSTKEEGHGLGLATTKKTVDELGGSIQFTNQSGGTKVIVTWTQAVITSAQVQNDAPQAAADQSEQHHRSAIPISDRIPRTETQRKPAILVIEDEASVREVAKGMLEHLGFEVLEAADAFAALRIFKENIQHISGVLLDLKMPKKDGWECLSELRELAPNLPVTICSGYDPQEDMRATFEDDDHLSFLKKPYRLTELKDNLGPLLE